MTKITISDFLKMPTATLLLSPVVGRRTSYQEVVHMECPPSHPSISCPVTRHASCLAEWLVVLQKVAEDRGPEQPSTFYRCEKASRLCKEIQSLGRRVSEAGQVWKLVICRKECSMDSMYFLAHHYLSWQKELEASCLRACLIGWGLTLPR